jgi:hypothetical protein
VSWRGAVVAVALSLGAASAVGGQRAGGPEGRSSPEVEVRATASRTALWPGDRVAYVVEFVCAPEVDLVAEDLAGERLRLEGLELVGAVVDRRVRTDGRAAYRVVYELATYAVGVPSLGIGELAVRYYRRGADGSLDGTHPAGVARAPAVTLAWRSTLPETRPALRDERPPEPIPPLVGVLMPAGWTLIGLSAIPLVWWTARTARRTRPRRAARRHRPLRALAAEVDALAARYRDGEADGEEVCRRLDALVRELAERWTGGRVVALTATELAARVRDGGRGAAAAAIAELLGACERARYGGPSHSPPPARVAELLAAARALVTDGRR